VSVIADEQGTEPSPRWDVLSDVIEARIAEMQRLKAKAGSADKPLPLKSMRETRRSSSGTGRGSRVAGLWPPQSSVVETPRPGSAEVRSEVMLCVASVLPRAPAFCESVLFVT
jgi:hypothetical protein